MTESLAFYIAAFITVFAVVCMIFQSNPVASAIYLVLSFFSLAGIYVMLGAHFVAALQILVYAGAIMVLFIFVIMLLNLGKDELLFDRIDTRRVFVSLIGLVLFGFFTYFIFKIPSGAGFAEVSKTFGSANEVAKLMLGDYVVPFEIMGILLLVGLVGAVLMGRREET